MAKVKKGDKVHVHGRTCTVKSVSGGRFSATCGPPRGKRKGKRSKGLGKISRRRGHKGGRATCGIPAGLLNRLPTGAADALKSACLEQQGGLDKLLAKMQKGRKSEASTTDKVAMAAAGKMLADMTAYTKKVDAKAKAIYRGAKLNDLYKEIAAQPRASKAGKKVETYSMNDPRYDASLAGVRRRQRHRR